MSIRHNWGSDHTAPYRTKAEMFSEREALDKNMGRRNHTEAEMIQERGTFYKNRGRAKRPK